MKASEINAKIEKIKGMSGLSDKVKADMVSVWEKKLPAAEKAENKGNRVPVGRSDREFKVDDVVYNKKHKTLGIVRMEPESGELTTDADGNVPLTDLEHYSRSDLKHQKAQVAPSTRKEIEDRNLATLEPEKQKRSRKKSSEPKVKTKSTYKYRGKNLEDLSDEDCEEAVREIGRASCRERVSSPV